MPWGIGLKYQIYPWLIMRSEVLDNFAIGSGSLDTMHNVSGTVSLEVRFGGHRPSYYPWNPSSYVW
jgi:hypothetical protein